MHLKHSSFGVSTVIPTLLLLFLEDLTINCLVPVSDMLVNNGVASNETSVLFDAFTVLVISAK